MEGLTPEVALDFAGRTGGNLILLLVIVGLLRGWLVPKPWVDDIRRDRDEWKQVARGGVQQAAETTRAQARTVTVAEEAAKVIAEVMRQQQAQSAPQAQGGQGTSPP